MGTKGYYAVVFNGKIYVFSSHTDAYPRRLGQVLLDEIRNCNMEEWKELIKNSIVIQNEDEHNRFFSTPKIETRYQIIQYLQNSDAYKIFYRNMNIDQAIEIFTYNDYSRLYDYSYSLHNILKTQFLYTIYYENYQYFEHDIYEIIHKYDCSYGYINDLDKEEFIFDNLKDYKKYRFFFSELPENLSKYCINY